jgi:hypothetical protein
MPNAQVEIIPDTGHLVFLEAPDKYRELLLGFLGRSRLPCRLKQYEARRSCRIQVMIANFDPAVPTCRENLTCRIAPFDSLCAAGA